MHTPKAVNLMSTTIEGGEVALDTVQSAVGDWQPLLDKMQIFCEVMDGVSEARLVAELSVELSHVCANRSIRTPLWRGLCCLQRIR